jgi:Rho-associated protein kinase 1
MMFVLYNKEDIQFKKKKMLKYLKTIYTYIIMLLNNTNVANIKKDLNENISENDFLPLRKLGRGSFGDVYLVRHKTSGLLYAMKTLSKKNNLEESWLRYVQTERDVLASSKNPFIVRLIYAF